MFRTNDRKNESGFALLLAMWAMLLLAVLGGSIMMDARGTKTVSSNILAETKQRIAADGAINRVVLALLDPRDNLRLRLDGTAIPLPIFGHDFYIRVASEKGKIDINSASTDILNAVLKSQKLDNQKFETLTEKIIEWRTPVASLKRDVLISEYRQANLAYGPRFGRFQTIDELRLVLGMTDELVAKIIPMVTVWSGDSIVDRGVASEAVLTVLSVNGDNFASNQLNANKNSTSVEVQRLPALGEVMSISISLRRQPEIEIRFAAIQIAGDRVIPFKTLEWR